MDNMTLKEILSEQFQIEKELYDFCIECIKKIYGKDNHLAVNEFQDSFNHRDYNGCFYTFEGLDYAVNRLQKKEKSNE
jgi:hypothetical protein